MPVRSRCTAWRRGGRSAGPGLRGHADGGLLKDLTVVETVQYTARLFAVSRPVAEVLERAGITKIADRRAEKCSGGEQQRLRFAMALIPDPELLILGEPTQGMDVAGRRGFWTAIREDAAPGPDDHLPHAGSKIPSSPAPSQRPQP